MTNCTTLNQKRLKRQNITKWRYDRKMKPLETEIKKAIDTAKDLCYPREVINKLKEAQSEAEIEQIMIGARKRTPD